MKKLKSPVTYMGAKTRLAPKILDIINMPRTGRFVDVCCGGGSVSIELINRGHDPHMITMIDCSWWGHFWKRIGERNFDMDVLRAVYNELFAEADVDDYQSILERCLDKEMRPDWKIYYTLFMQAGGFGGKPLGWDTEVGFKPYSFRSYWKPTATSSRSYPVNPMSPMPERVIERCEQIAERMSPIRGIFDRAENVDYNDAPNYRDVVYIDPPYRKRTKYHHNINLEDVIFNASQTNDVYVSAYRPFGERSYQFDFMKKGGVSGKRSGKPIEHLNYISCRSLLSADDLYNVDIEVISYD